jgi:signal transduction histidine kinase
MPPGELCFDYALRGETKVCEVLVRHRKTDRDLIIRSAAAPIWYNGEIIGAVAIHTDITERKQVEKERSEMLVQLEAKNSLLEAVLQQMTAGVIISEASSGRLMLRNELVTQLLGDSFALADNIEQYQQYQGFHADGRSYAPDEWPIVRSISTGEVVTNEEINYLCGDGTYRLLSVSSTPVRNHKGQIIAGVVTFYDLTDSKKVQEELRKTLLRERELSELRSSFVSLVSHEFRTPLTTIQSSAELLERYQERLASEKKLTHYHRIQSAISQMTHLLNEVLLIGQAEAGKLQFNPQPLDLVAFCRELVEGMQVMVDNRHSGKSHAHRLSCTVSGECKDAEMDEKLLRHILTNLLSNAIKYSPDGGSVQFALIGNDNDVIFQITDSGIGIPEEDKKQLFKSFSRASNVGTIQGTGLGLAIVNPLLSVSEN